MEHLTLRAETDTATSRPVIPIYFIHTIQTPVCDLPGCWCQNNKATIAQYLTAIGKSELMLHEAASFAENKTV